MITWRQIHAGDVVAGRDGRHWRVIERGEPAAWLAAGETGPFVLSYEGSTLRVGMRLDDPAPLVARAEGLDDDAAAVQTMINGGVPVEVISEQFSPPASAPAADVKRDRWGRYVLPHPITGAEQSWVRVTTVARTLADEYNLTAWKMRQVARGIARRPDLAAGAAAADPEADKGALNKIAEQAMEAVASGAGATMGTALHSLTATIDRGGDLPDGLSEAVTRDLWQYVKCMKGHGLRAQAIERIVCLPEYGVAGTFDRIVSQPSGNAHAAALTVLDVKSAKDVTYSWLETAMQLAAYARASHVWDAAAREWLPMPEVDQTRGLVLHLPAGKGAAQLYGIDLIKGWQAFRHAIDVRDMRTESKSWGWVVANDPAAAFLLRVRRAADQDELAALWDEGQRRGLWTEEVNEAAAYRFDEIYGTTDT